MGGSATSSSANQWEKRALLLPWALARCVGATTARLPATSNACPNQGRVLACDAWQVGMAEFSGGLAMVNIDLPEAESQRLFRALDLDGDGVITRDEIAALFGREIKVVESRNLLAERAAARKQEKEKKRNRQRDEFAKLGSAQYTEWLQGELKRKSVGEARFTTAMGGVGNTRVRLPACGQLCFAHTVTRALRGDRTHAQSRYGLCRDRWHTSNPRTCRADWSSGLHCSSDWFQRVR